MLKRRFCCVLLFFLLSSTVAISAERATLTVAAPWEVNSVDPAIAGFAFLRLQVLETLVDADAEGQLRPGLATAWTSDAEGLTWRFTLRQGVSFHDATPLTTAAAVAALERAAQQPGPLGKAPIATIAAERDTVIIGLDSPFTALPALLTHSTTAIVAPSAFDAAGRPQAAIGTGPYQVNQFSPPQRLTLTRFDQYWGEQATFAAVEYLAAGRAETRALLAESGDADLVFTLDPSGFARLGRVATVERMAVPIPRVVTLKVNASHPFLNDLRARQALSLAIDRQGIAAGIIRFPEAAATQLFPPALGDWHAVDLAPLAHDPARARQLLSELGWQPGAGGILQRDGQRFALTLRTFPDRPELPLIAAALQQQWRQIGVELTVSIGNYSEIPAGHQDGSLEVGLYARNYGLTPDPIGTVLTDFGRGGGDWGAMGWDNPNVSQALATIAATADETTRGPQIATVVTALQEELPLIPIVWYQHTVAIARDLKGVVVDPLERSYGLSQIRRAK